MGPCCGKETDHGGESGLDASKDPLNEGGHKRKFSSLALEEGDQGGKVYGVLGNLENKQISSPIE